MREPSIACIGGLPNRSANLKLCNKILSGSADTQATAAHRFSLPATKNKTDILPPKKLPSKKIETFVIN